MEHGIIVFGASGSGTTTLAKELARVLNFAHFDADDYYWQKQDNKGKQPEENVCENALSVRP